MNEPTGTPPVAASTPTSAAAPAYVAPEPTNTLAMIFGALLAVVGFVFAISHVVFNFWMLFDPTPAVRLDSLSGRFLRFLDGTGSVAVFIAIGLMLWPDRTSSMLGRIVFGIWVLGTLVALVAEQRLGYPGYASGFMR